MLKPALCSTLLLSVLMVSTVTADMVTLDAIADTAIFQDNTSNSNGSGDFFHVGNNGGNAPRRGLIRFDLSSIPTGATITNVTLSAFVSQGNMTDVDISLHRLTADWGESTSDAPGGEGGGTAAAIGDATWNENFFGTSNWANAGGDFAATASASTIVGANGSYFWSADGLVNDVQSWLDGGTGNFGWILIGDETAASTSKRFNSRSNSGNNPFLTVEFSTIPEPSSAVLLSGGVAALLIRRRQAN